MVKHRMWRGKLAISIASVTARSNLFAFGLHAIRRVSIADLSGRDERKIEDRSPENCGG